MNENVSPFHGCIRSLRVNNVIQNLISNKTSHNNIGQCFAKIERGAYFRGDSYAIYNDAFELAENLNISFSFRTSERNGVLATISNVDNSPALSIEIQNGAVVFSIDSGMGIVTNVTSKLPQFTICNNQWHHLTATLSSELSLMVDGIIQTWVLAETGSLRDIIAPLYIGGLPNEAPYGTLKVRENFKGCISNLRFGSANVPIEWSTFYDLNNVSPNSCPV